MTDESLLGPREAAAAPLEGAHLLTVTGPDAASFLHGQLANDVAGMAVGSARRSLYLNHRGHALAEVMVLRRGRQEFELVEEGGAAAWVLAELQRHVIFDDLTLGALVPVGLVTLQGPGAPAVAGALGAEPQGPEALAAAPAADPPFTAWARARSAAGGYDLLVADGAGGAMLNALVVAGARLAAPGEPDLWRVRALAALAPQDAGEGVLPQEAGLEAALSYRKGCYLGQEIMARIEARGNLRRGLARVRLTADPRAAAAAGDWRELRLGGRVVGRLGTVASAPGSVHADGAQAGGAPAGGALAGGGYEALAVLRKDLPDGAELEAAGATAAVVAV